MRKVACLVVLMFAVIGLSGCPKSSLVLARDVAATNLAFERGVTVVHHDAPGACDNNCEAAMLNVAKKIAQGDDAIVSLLQKNDKQGALVQIDNVIAAIDDAMTNGLLAVKDDAKRAEWHAILLSIRGIFVTTKALLA
jgi:hypothetical protein